MVDLQPLVRQVCWGQYANLAAVVGEEDRFVGEPPVANYELAIDPLEFGFLLDFTAPFNWLRAALRPGLSAQPARQPLPLGAS